MSASCREMGKSGINKHITLTRQPSPGALAITTNFRPFRFDGPLGNPEVTLFVFRFMLLASWL